MQIKFTKYEAGKTYPVVLPNGRIIEVDGEFLEKSARSEVIEITRFQWCLVNDRIDELESELKLLKEKNS